MTRWSEIMAKLIPWLDTDARDARVRKESERVRREAEALAPVIDAQTEYLVRKGEINGFTRQLEAGFQKKIGGA
jgi:hypothetical protein